MQVIRPTLVALSFAFVASAPAFGQLTTHALGKVHQQWTAGLELVPADTQERPRAITYSDLYYTRLKVHRIGSYVMLPLFAVQYLAGQKLLNEANPPGWAKGTHGAVAGGVAVLFGVNTVTGLWNLWDCRHEQSGRARKYLHTLLMLGADAGFVWTGQTAEDAGEGDNHGSGGRHHRDVALASFGLATVSTAMMWLWK